MGNTKHTQTPWETDNGVRHEWEGIAIWHVGGGELVAHVVPDHHECNNVEIKAFEANAEFICRAVNSHAALLDSARQLLEYFEAIHHPEIDDGHGGYADAGYECSYCAAMDAARDAIAKAKGEPAP